MPKVKKTSIKIYWKYNNSHKYLREVIRYKYPYKSIMHDFLVSQWVYFPNKNNRFNVCWVFFL